MERYCIQVEKWRSNTAVVRKWRRHLARGGHGCGSGDGTLHCLGNVDPNPAGLGIVDRHCNSWEVGVKPCKGEEVGWSPAVFRKWGWNPVGMGSGDRTVRAWGVGYRTLLWR